MPETSGFRLTGQVIQILEKGGYSTRELMEEINRTLTSLAESAVEI